MDWTPLLNLGGLGCVLIWFMLRSEPRLAKIEEAIDRFSRSILLQTIAQPGVSKAVQEQADKIIEELNEAAKGRHK